MYSSQGTRFDGNRLAHTLRTKFGVPGGAPSFEWKALGRDCGVCFKGCPAGVRLLAGSVDSNCESIVRKRRGVKRTHPRGAEEQIPEVLLGTVAMDDGKPAAANTLYAAQRGVRSMQKLLQKRSKEEEQNAQAAIAVDRSLGAFDEETAGKMDGVQFLVNPRSFTQTVENIFNASFLIKKGKAAIGVNPTEGLWLQPRHEQEDEPPATQAVVSFTMKDWRRLCAARGLEKGDIPDRSNGKDSHTPEKETAS